MSNKYNDITINTLQLFLTRFVLRKKSLIRKKKTTDNIDIKLKSLNDNIIAIRKTIRLLKQDEFTSADFDNFLKECCKKRGRPSKKEQLEKVEEHFDMNM